MLDFDSIMEKRLSGYPYHFRMDGTCECHEISNAFICAPSSPNIPEVTGPISTTSWRYPFGCRGKAD
jgi:hypothetical protein